MGRTTKSLTHPSSYLHPQEMVELSGLESWLTRTGLEGTFFVSTDAVRTGV